MFKKTIARLCSRKRVLLKPLSTVLVHASSAVTFTKEETEKTDQEAKESVSDNHAQNAEAPTSVREILKGFARENVHAWFEERRASQQGPHPPGTLIMVSIIRTAVVTVRPEVSLKPVLNWANVCSPNILRTPRRTMIRFLIELLVRRIWFGQFELDFILNWLVMRCKVGPELAADAQQTA